MSIPAKPAPLAVKLQELRAARVTYKTGELLATPVSFFSFACLARFPFLPDCEDELRDGRQGGRIDQDFLKHGDHSFQGAPPALGLCRHQAILPCLVPAMDGWMKLDRPGAERLGGLPRRPCTGREGALVCRRGCPTRDSHLPRCTTSRIGSSTARSTE